jgi:hypothetical protein
MIDTRRRIKKKILAGFADSLKRKMPSIAAPSDPTPTQTP